MNSFINIRYIALIVFLNLPLFARQSDITFGALKRIYPSNVTQTEVLITKSPVDGNTLFASANTINFSPFFVSEGVYATTDAGQNWAGSDTCKGGPFLSFHGGDPGIAIDKNGTFIIVRRGATPLTGLYSHYSTNYGVTWSAQLAVTTEDLERGVLASDGSASSPYYGRTYAAWVKYAPPFPVSISYSANGGASWAASKVVNSPVNRNSGGDIVLGKDGRVYLTWATVISTSPFTETGIGFASSADGGSTWSVTEKAITINGISGLLSAKQNIRVNSLPRIDIDKTNGPHSGNIYIVTTQKNLAPAGSDPDIVLFKSSDNGVSWTAGVRVNRDELNNGKTQYFPAVCVDDYGGVNVVYYDDRGTTNDSASVYLSRSTDGGNTWSDYKLTANNFRPTPIGGLGQGYQGDNIGITYSAGKLFPVWMDNSSGIYQIWTREIQVNPVGVSESGDDINRSLTLYNFPNPFSERTTLVVGGVGLVASDEEISIKVYNMMGENVAVLEPRLRQSDRLEAELKATGLPAGIYFAELRLNGARRILQMALVK